MILKYLTKMNYDRCHGWQFRINYYNRQYSKFFNKNKYGGMNKAKEAAITFRDQFIKQNKLEHYLHRKYTGLDIPKNTSTRITTRTPIIGVCLFLHKKKSGDYYTWTGYWQENKKIKRKHFAIIKYGYTEAFQLACQARYENKGILIVKDQKLLPEKPKVKYKIMGKNG